MPIRKRRTREHVIEDISENHLERIVLLRGHLLRRPERDYGVDVTMFHFSDDGSLENGEVRFQLKATDNLNVIKNGQIVSHPIKTGDLHYWSMEIYPFILVVHDAAENCSYWLDIKDYVERNPDRLDPDKETVNVHVPVKNILNIKTIDLFRSKSLAIVKRLRNQGGFPDVRDKPR